MHNLQVMRSLVTKGVDTKLSGVRNDQYNKDPFQIEMNQPDAKET